MTCSRLALAVAGRGARLSRCCPSRRTPGLPAPTSISASRCSPTCRYLPPAVADLLRAYPFDFLYGNIAADSSIAKHYAPLGRHCHYWHVGQEIHDLAATDALRAFGLGYLCHLAADTIAHNYFVPRQLMLTSSTAAVGHSYWETRVEAHLGDAYAKAAKDVILLDHAPADAHLDRIIAPTIFSVRTNRRLFRGMVHLTETTSWQRASQVAREYSRWPLTDEDVERHLGLSFDFMIELLADSGARGPPARPVGRAAAEDRQGDAPPGAPGRRPARHRPAAETRPTSTSGSPSGRWTTGPGSRGSSPGARPEGSAPSPTRLVSGRPLISLVGCSPAARDCDHQPCFAAHGCDGVPPASSGPLAGQDSVPQRVTFSAEPAPLIAGDGSAGCWCSCRHDSLLGGTAAASRSTSSDSATGRYRGLVGVPLDGAPSRWRSTAHRHGWRRDRHRCQSSWCRAAGGRLPERSDHGSAGLRQAECAAAAARIQRENARSRQVSLASRDTAATLAGPVPAAPAAPDHQRLRRRAGVQRRGDEPAHRDRLRRRGRGAGSGGRRGAWWRWWPTSISRDARSTSTTVPGWSPAYFHLSRVDVAEGDTVAAGQRIGGGGSERAGDRAAPALGRAVRDDLGGSDELCWSWREGE